MANRDHLKIIQQGVSVWNDWRKKNPEVRPDLNRAVLYETKFMGANLSRADLTGAILRRITFEGADLSGALLMGAILHQANFKAADLSGANLTSADLFDADLTRADLSGANCHGVNFFLATLRHAFLIDATLSQTYLRRTDFQGADLTRADLSFADLTGANLSGADFSKAIFWGTHLSGSLLLETKFYNSDFGNSKITNCDLRNVLGLNKVKHCGPSYIGIDTFFKSKGKIPLSFLKGCGIDQEVAKYLLKEARTKIHYSCFISYSSKDEKFAKKLKKDLELKNIKCWFFPEDATWGRDTYKNIDLAIKAHDKLIMICSKDSLNSEPVLREIERAIQEEKARKEKNKETERVLFPVIIDNYLFDKWEHYLKADFLKITIGDFKGWKDLKEYNNAILKLVKALQKR